MGENGEGGKSKSSPPSGLQGLPDHGGEQAAANAGVKTEAQIKSDNALREAAYQAAYQAAIKAGLTHEQALDHVDSK